MTTPYKCESKECKISNRFLPPLNKDSLTICHMLSVDLSVDLQCDHCDSWSADKWCCVQACIDELQRQHERKKGENQSLPFLSFSDPNG